VHAGSLSVVVLVLVMQVALDTRARALRVDAQRQAASTDLPGGGIAGHVALGSGLQVTAAERVAAEALRAPLRAGDAEALVVTVCDAFAGGDARLAEVSECNAIQDSVAEVVRVAASGSPAFGESDIA